MTDIPDIALSVRQPWAWAIVHAGKDVENRSTFAITKGDMKPNKHIAIHAAQGMTQDEYESAKAFMARIGVTCPPPADLVRGAIIGHAKVISVVKESKSPWFMGPRGLLLLHQTAIDPIPARGALGYFKWERADTKPEPLPWMRKYGAAAIEAPAAPAPAPATGADLFSQE